MKKNYFFTFLCCLGLSSSAFAQTVILDFESAPKSAVLQYFGSTLEPQLTGVINNPDKKGINLSAKVGEFKKPAASQTWAGAYSNPNPVTQLDLVKGSTICMKVWSDHVGNVMIKLEEGVSGAANWEQKVDIKEANKWVEVCFDPSVKSPVAPNNVAAGFSYKKVVLFFDFDIVLPAEKTWYFDDLVVKSSGVSTKDLYTDGLIKVQPTVSDDLIQVAFSSEFDAQAKQINIVALDGRRVQSYQVAPNTTQETVSVKDLANGLYILQAFSNGHYQSTKIVVNH
jgi:Secretion system C-terminal sorting domain